MMQQQAELEVQPTDEEMERLLREELDRVNKKRKEETREYRKVIAQQEKLLAHIKLDIELADKDLKLSNENYKVLEGNYVNLSERVDKVLKSNESLIPIINEYETKFMHVAEELEVNKLESEEKLVEAKRVFRQEVIAQQRAISGTLSAKEMSLQNKLHIAEELLLEFEEKHQKSLELLQKFADLDPVDTVTEGIHEAMALLKQHWASSGEPQETRISRLRQETMAFLTVE